MLKKGGEKRMDGGGGILRYLYVKTLFVMLLNFTMLCYVTLYMLRYATLWLLSNSE